MSVPAIARRSRNPYVVRAAFFAGLGGLLFGYDTGVIGGALPLMANEFHWTSPFEKGVITSSLLLGAALGAMIGGRLSDRYGRRRLIIATSIVFVVGILGSSLAPDALVLVASRVVIGLGVGAASVVVPLYIGEVAPPAVRGGLVSLNQLAITSGILVSQVIAYFLTNSGEWRVMVAIALIPSLALGFGMLRQPESPAWLVEKGHDDQARAILHHARGVDDDIEGEIRGIGRIAEQREGGRALLDAAIRPALVIGISLAVIQQLTGINTVIYFAPTLLEQAGLGDKAAIGGTVVVGLINVILTIVAIRLLDRVGRRPLLLWGTVGMVVGLIALGAAFVGQSTAISTSHAVVAIIALCVYVGSFAIGLGPVFWLLVSEIYPLRVRGSGTSTAGIANWLANFVVAVSYLSLLAAIGRPATFWLYAAISVGSYVFMRLKVPETKGRSLAEIEADLSGTAARPGGGDGTGRVGEQLAH